MRKQHINEITCGFPVSSGAPNLLHERYRLRRTSDRARSLRFLNSAGVRSNARRGALHVAGRRRRPPPGRHANSPKLRIIELSSREPAGYAPAAARRLTSITCAPRPLRPRFSYRILIAGGDWEVGEPLRARLSPGQPRSAPDAVDGGPIAISFVNWDHPDGHGEIRLRCGTLGETRLTPQGYFHAKLRGPVSAARAEHARGVQPQLPRRLRRSSLQTPDPAAGAGTAPSGERRRALSPFHG
jgi:hypothetical protein